MKKIVLALIIVLSIVSCNKETTLEKKETTLENKGYSTVFGTFESPNIKEVELSKIQYGKKIVIGTSVLNEKKEYGFALKSLEEGFYMLGPNGMDYPIYIKGSKTFEINFSPMNGYTLVASPDEENTIVSNWIQSIDTLKVFKAGMANSKTFEQFFPFYEEFLPEVRKFHEEIHTKNTLFNQRMHAYVDLKLESVALNFVFTPRMKHPTRKDMASFYAEFMKGDNFNSDIVLDLPEGIRALKMHQMYKAMHTGEDMKKKNYIKEMFSGIEVSILRAHLSLNFLNSFKTYNERYTSFIEPLRKDIALSTYVTSEVEKFEMTIKTMDVGIQGYPFTYKDINGKDVSFSDFKGKLVYIDIWAMWCAPCKQQIPYLQKLEKELHGKDIVFLSISVDKPGKKEKWEKFVKEKELTGIQLFSDNAFNTRIAKDYKINAIPRFLLFDKKGRILDANADRPSLPRLKKHLLQLLKK